MGEALGLARDQLVGLRPILLAASPELGGLIVQCSAEISPGAELAPDPVEVAEIRWAVRCPEPSAETVLALASLIDNRAALPKRSGL